MCFMLYICHSVVQFHNISVQCGINYQARSVTQSSGLQKVIRPVNNRPAATILHTDGERCICANFAVLCIVWRTVSGWMVFGLPQWLSRLKLNQMCLCDIEGSYRYHPSSPPDHLFTSWTPGDYVNSVFSARGEKSGALGVTYKCIDLLTLTNLRLLDSLEWRMLPVCH